MEIYEIDNAKYLDYLKVQYGYEIDEDPDIEFDDNDFVIIHD